MTLRVSTLTLNPALDYVATARKVSPTHKIRTTSDGLTPGGGGVNVARVLRELGADAMAVVPVGGPAGSILLGLLSDAGVPCRSNPIEGSTRICVTALDQESGEEYRLVPPGPELDDTEWRMAAQGLFMDEPDWVVASGSLPRGVPSDAYAEIARMARAEGIPFALDTSGAALAAALHDDAMIDLAKLSLGELESLAGKKLSEDWEAEGEALHLVRERRVARMMAVTLGGDGAFLATEKGILRRRSPRVEVKSALGAGDSFLAAMVMALHTGIEPMNGVTRDVPMPSRALEHAVLVGSAAAAAGGAAHLRLADVERLRQRVAVEA